MVSTLWNAGAEALDDLVDGGGDSALTPNERLVAGTACLALLPALAIDRLAAPEALGRLWLRDLAEHTVESAEGQLADTSRDPGALAWARVMRAYAGKTGANYARDAVMAARCAVEDPGQLRGWQVLGQLLGVLRQTHNDNDVRPPEDDEDLANGTPTLLLAHALEASSPAERERLLALRTAARTSVLARADLRSLLHAPPVVTGYRRRIGALRRSALDLLEWLAEPSPFRAAIAARIDDSAVLAIPSSVAARVA
ncbi:polyprenyl synthase [Streptomyces sp. NPDC048629]|uniref:polyprenyl synthase n=1 Tax=Streptomyces sp. NPDC048629 TaxID=3154824 RepID=UPI0034374975